MIRCLRPLAVVAALSTVLGLGGCTSLIRHPAPQASPPAKFEFVVINDTPYNDFDEAMLREALPKIKAINPPFVIHAGDTQSGGAVCGPADDRFAKLQADLLPTPLIYSPGDNEWTDCDRQVDPATGKKFSELQRLSILRKRFFSQPVPLEAQAHYVQQAEMVENARFDHAGLVFVTIHMVGTNNGREFVMGDDLREAAKAADARDAANVKWLKQAFAHARKTHAQGVVIAMQADMNGVKPEGRDKPCTNATAAENPTCDGFALFRRAMLKQTKAFKKPVFLIHGDTDPFTLTHGLQGLPIANLWRLNAAGDAGTDKSGKPYGVHDVTHVWIDLGSPDPLKAEGIVTGKIPDSHD